jgi:hypothetical protein
MLAAVGPTGVMKSGFKFAHEKRNFGERKLCRVGRYPVVCFL